MLAYNGWRRLGPVRTLNVAKQGLTFVIVGCSLIAVDSAVFVVLSAVGLSPWWSNVAGRVAGALVGFWANGRITFGSPGFPRFGYRRFARFLVSWTVVTVLSTILVATLADHLSLETAWLAKPVVEVCLAVATFFISREWVYK